MSNTMFDRRDQAIVDQIDRELGLDSAPPALLFQRALELGASEMLLATATWVERNSDGQPIALPYVPLLVQHRGRRFARDFVRTMCVTRQEYGDDHTHRRAFWNDPAAQALFDEREASLSFALELAELDPNELLSKHGNVLTQWFERVEGMHVGHVTRVEQTAARHLRFIDSRRELEAVLRLPKKEQQRAATRCPANGWNIVLKGYVLSKHGPNSYEGRMIESGIYQQLLSYPHQGAIIYRWLMEGYWRFAEESIASHPDPLTITAEQVAALRLNESPVTRQLAYQDWHVLQLDHNLRVRLPGKGLPVVLQHDASSAEAEPLREGDEVIVARLLTKELPSQVTPGGRTFTLPLSPARRPTEDMLERSHQHFYVGNIRSANWLE